MTIKKIIAVVSAIALVMALTACGNKPQDSSEPLSTMEQGDSSQVAEELEDSNPSTEPMNADPNQGVGNGNIYTNEFFKLNFEFPQDWICSSETGYGDVTFPYFQSLNDDNSYAYFRLSGTEGLPEHDVLEVRRIKVNGLTFDCNLTGVSTGEGEDIKYEDVGISFTIEDGGVEIICTFHNPECETMEDYQAFIDSISK